MRKASLLLLTIAMLFAGTTAAQAHITQFEVDAVFIDDQGGVIGVTGTITCSEGERFAINGEAFQGTRENPKESVVFFAKRGTCEGARQRWFTDEVRQDGLFTCDRPAGAHARAQSYFDRTLHDEKTFDGAVKVVCR